MYTIFNVKLTFYFKQYNIIYASIIQNTKTIKKIKYTTTKTKKKKHWKYTNGSLTVLVGGYRGRKTISFEDTQEKGKRTRKRKQYELVNHSAKADIP